MPLSRLGGRVERVKPDLSKVCKTLMKCTLHHSDPLGIQPDMEKKDVRIQLVISPTEVAEIDEWRAENRIWSRSEAIRQLVAEGIKAKREQARRLKEDR